MGEPRQQVVTTIERLGRRAVRLFSRRQNPMPPPETIARIMSWQYAHDPNLLSLWERYGFHVLPVHFYSPVPKLADLPPNLWAKASELPGIDMREHQQRELLEQLKSDFKHEYDAFMREPSVDPPRFYISNPMFGAVDGEMLYAMIRCHKPRRLIEVGAGFSTLATAEAATKNASEGTPVEVLSIEPYPPDFLSALVLDNWSLRQTPVQCVGIDEFARLEASDILFIDSSHVVKVGSDVLYLYLEVIPRLKPGVVVHVHDIFLPYDYPNEWVHSEHRFWSEQYLLQAFLTFNAEFEILWASNYMSQRHPDALLDAFASYTRGRGAGSLWMRRRSQSR
jgi:predicted O-methyltransferase YrrM